jgi:predicted GNAT superfamily acetyltransferase
MMPDLFAEPVLTEAVLTEAGEAAARAAKAAGVVIRELGTLDELGGMIALFDEIWAPENGNSSLRLDLLRAMTKAGNYAAGAFDLVSGELLGACIGFFGPPAHAELHSHIAGVGPAGLGRAVGFALKVHQRAWCLRRDVRAIAWTYDPLIRRNSYFNLVKLGARPVEYLRNFYGTMDDAINGGTDTDRVLVHWDLCSELVADASCGRPRQASFAAERERGAVTALSPGPHGLPVPGLQADPLSAAGLPADPLSAAGLPADPLSAAGLPAGGGSGVRTLLVGIPADIEAMRVSDPAAAAAWRAALRDVLSPLLSSGARVTGFDREGWYVVSLGGDVR